MALGWIPWAFKTFLKNLQVFEMRHLCDEVTNSKIQVSFKVGSQFPLFFSNGLQMALASLSRVFKMILKNLQRVEMRHLGAKVTNSNIQVLSSLSHIFLYFSQMVYKWPWHGFLGLSKRFWKIFKVLTLGTELVRCLISKLEYLQVSLTISIIFLVFSFICLKLFTKWPSHCCQYERE